MSRPRSLHIKSEQAKDVAVLRCAGRIGREEALHLRKNAGSVCRECALLCWISQGWRCSTPEVSGCSSFCIVGLVTTAFN